MVSPNFILEMRKISKSFPGVQALDKVDLNLRKGEVHILLGENGAGKSTLMKILSGAYQPDDGEIYLDGHRVYIKNPRIAQHLGIRIIYQEFNLVPHLSVAANIFLGQEFTRRPGFLDRDEMKKKSKEVLNSLGLELDPDLPVKVLSVAQQQMVEVARALAFDARILIMDEPTSALTENEIGTLFQTIRIIKKKGVSIIYISHRLEELFQIGDRVSVLRDGKYIGTYDITKVSKSQLIRLMANREIKDHYPRVRGEIGETLLFVKGLNRGNQLRNIHLELRAGEILGIAGLMGAGRTELARAIFGADRIDSGEIRIMDKPVRIKSPAAAVNAGIGFLSEDRKQSGLILSLSIKENISLPNLDQLVKMGLIQKQAERQMTEKYVRELRIKTPHIQQRTLHLSGGNQQKVVLAKWLARQAKILIFDEPTRGIDIASKIEIYKLMNQLTAEGAGIIMISSELPEILGMSDRILVMRNGEICGEFSAESATQEKILATALGEIT